MAVIQNPDNAGAACNFKDTTELPTFISGLPHYPNYRLGALPGSPCDTLTGISETTRAAQEKILKIYPNPATDFVIIDYGYTNWSKGKVSLEITNQMGQIIEQRPLPEYSAIQKIDLSRWASGVYLVALKRGAQLVAKDKFAKQ